MEELKKYFTNLLILQYKNKPKAKATIEALVDIAFYGNGGIFPIILQNAYDLDNALGKQLDIIGKYLGYDRMLPIPLDNYFKYDDYNEVETSKGYSDYSQERNTYPYAEYRYDNYSYSPIQDDIYRKILKMISVLKTKSLSLGNIDEVLKDIFENKIYVVEKDKEIEYHIVSTELPLLDNQTKLDIFFKKYFPKPMGCVITVIRD